MSKSKLYREAVMRGENPRIMSEHPIIPATENEDLYYYAFNYRNAPTCYAEGAWKELEACVNRIREAERGRFKA